MEIWKKLIKRIRRRTYSDALDCQAAIDLETIGDHVRSDQLVGGDLLHKSVIGNLVEDDQVVQLLLGLSLGPLQLCVWDVVFDGTDCLSILTSIQVAKAAKFTFFLDLPLPDFSALGALAVCFWACLAG